VFVVGDAFYTISALLNRCLRPILDLVRFVVFTK